MKSYDDWRDAGFQVKKGEQASGRDRNFRALFTRAQVEERRDFDKPQGGPHA